MATNFLNFCNMKGDFKYLQPLWSFSNSNTGLICSKIFDDVREILVQVDKAVYGTMYIYISLSHSVTSRNQLLWPSVRATVSKLGLDYRGNHCGLMRAGCSLLLHVSEDEHRLFKQFFKRGEDSIFFR